MSSDQNRMNEDPTSPAQDADDKELGRREFLESIRNVAVFAAPVAAVLMSSRRAIAQSGE